MMTKRQALYAELAKGGPGHDGYAFDADVFCVDCGRAILHNQCMSGELDAYLDTPDDIMLRDTDTTPQPIFFGESDTAQYCSDCGTYLYGPEE